MKEINPGHIFQIDNYPARESDYPIPPESMIQNYISFRKRVGNKYPGNGEYIFNGTSTQELLRVIIARSLYVNNQEPHIANEHLIQYCSNAIEDLEFRAAERRGSDYLEQFTADLNQFLYKGHNIESAETCQICGHIFCRRHNQETPS